MTRARTPWIWAAAGVWGGLVAGTVDVLWTWARGVGGLSVARAAALLALGAGGLAVAGLACGLVVAVVGVAAARAGARSRRARAALAAAIATPIVAADAIKMFTGRRAAAMPGRWAIVAALAAVGVFLVYQLASRYVAFEEGLAAETLPGRRRRAGMFVAAGLIVLSAAAEIANALVLRRLYPWFHATLAGLTVLCGVLAARVILVSRRATRPPLEDRGSPSSARTWPAKVGTNARVIAGSVAVMAAAGLGVAIARTSQTVRFAALERTTALAQLLRLYPRALRPAHVSAPVVVAGHDHLPPLPEGPRFPDRDIVLITIDALRADHVGAYGYQRRPTTPNLDRLAAEGVRFERAYAQAPHTSFSIASMLTGKYFPTLARLAPAEKHDPIAFLLRQYGIKTAAFYPPAVFFVDAQKLKAYAESHFGFEYIKFEYLDAPGRVRQIANYFEDEQPSHTFLWLHLFEPHEPYDSHPAFPFGRGDMDRYDSEIAAADAAVGQVVDDVRRRRPGTIIIVTADHGEEFEEHGGRYHGSSLHEEQIRVPLIISIPGVTPRVVGEQVELVDLAPTILSLLDIPIPTRMRGTDLGPWLAPDPADARRLPPAFAELEDKRMVVKGSEKLICDLNWGYCAYHDLVSDPGEKKNLAEERPERAAAMRQILDEWLDGHIRFEPVLARGAANPNGEEIPKPIERGRLGDLLAGPALAGLMLDPEQSLPVRREAAQLLVTLPPRRETAPALSRAARDPDPLVGDWASVGALRAGDQAAVPRVRRAVDDRAAPALLRVHAAMALAKRGDSAGVDVLAGALDDCEDRVLLCRLIILQLGALKDRRAVPALVKHLPEVQNRREMVDALGEIGDPAAIPPLIERLAGDEYVPVRAQAARALARIGRPEAVPALERAVREDTEASVVSAAKDALETLKRPP